MAKDESQNKDLNKKNRSSDAASRIIRRLQEKKEKTQNQKTKTDSNTRKILDKIPIQEINKVELTGELAKSAKILEQKLCSEDELIMALAKHNEVSFQGQKNSIIDILKDRQAISPAQYEELKEVNTYTIEIKGALPKPNKLDLALINHIVDYKLLDRKIIQIILRVQTQLNKLGIKYSIPDLLKLNKYFDKGMIDSLIQECQRKINIKRSVTVSVREKSVRKAAIFCKPPKRYPVVIWSLMFIFIGIIFLEISFSKNDKKKTSRIENKFTDTKNYKKRNNFDPKKLAKEIELQKKNKKQTHQKYMKKKGIVKWGNFLITKEQKNILAKRWNVDSRPGKIPIRLRVNNITYINRNKDHRLAVQGMIAIPKGLHFVLELQILDIYTQKVYISQKFHLYNTNIFRTIIAPLPKPFLPNIYFLKICLYPGDQKKFTLYFLKLKERKQWEFKFALGTINNIKLFYNKHNKKISKILYDLEKIYNSMSNIIKKQNTMGIKQFQKWSLNFSAQLARIQKNIDLHNGIIPISPGLDTHLQELLTFINLLFHEIQRWHTTFVFDEEKILNLQAKFEILFEKIKFFSSKQQKILDKEFKNKKLLFAKFFGR